MRRKTNMNIYEEVLGAGMAVRYNDDGIIEFVFLDEYDHAHVIAVSELDKGWRAKLLTAMSVSRKDLE